MSRTTGSVPAALRERLRRLSRPEFTAFCAALWAARGYDVRTDADGLTATRDGGRLRLLVVSPGRLSRTRARLARLRPGAQPGADSEQADAVDVVVVPTTGPFAERLAKRHEARLVGPDELADVLLYGVSRETATTLTTRHLGVPLSALLSTSTRGTRETGLVPLAAVAGVVCLVLAAAMAGVWLPTEPASLGATSPGATDGTTTAAPTQSGVNRSPSNFTDLGRTQSDGATGEYPPGVAEGFVDVGVLADAHARLADDRSYRLVIRHGRTESLDGTRQWVGAWQHAVVEDDQTWLYSVVGYEAAEDGTELVQYTVFSDGEFAYRRTDGISGPYYDRFPVRFASPEEYGPHTDRARQYLLRYLATTEVAVDRPSWNPDAYRLVATGQPTSLDENVSNYTATAIVSEAGFVSELTVEYTLQGGEREDRRFRLEYAAVGETELRAPSWYDDAQAATAADTANETANETGPETTTADATAG